MPDLPVFPIHGNHEFTPTNNQDYNEESNVLFNVFSSVWSKWLPAEAAAQYRARGFYDAPLRTSSGRELNNTRVLAINTLPCYNMNFYNIGQLRDPSGQIDWLEKRLFELEAANQTAIVMSHIPPGCWSCTNDWAQRLKALQERFQHIIRLSLYGHIHGESFGVVRSFGDDKAVGVNFWTGSLTSSEGRNPSFRIVELDEETLLPLNIETYFFDIRAAAINQSLDSWTFRHDVVAEYKAADDLRPSSMLRLSESLRDDETEALKYWTNYYSGGKGADSYTKCDKKCRKQAHCNTAFSTYVEKDKCRGWFDSYGMKDILYHLLEAIMDPWVKSKE